MAPFMLPWSAVLISLVFADALDHHQFMVAIDIGHSKAHSGAVSCTGLKEYEYNRRVAERLKDLFKREEGAKAFIINPNGENLPLAKRARNAFDQKADLLLSLHHDSVQPHYLLHHRSNDTLYHFCDRYTGYSLFISQAEPFAAANFKLAMCIGKVLSAQGFHPSYHHAEKIVGENRILLDSLGIYQFDELALLRNARLPAVLIECGILVNREEEKRMREREWTDRFCWALKEAVDIYIRTRTDSQHLFLMPPKVESHRDIIN